MCFCCSLFGVERVSKLDNGQVQGSSSDQHRANWLWFVLVGVVWCCGVGGCEAGGLECRLCVEVVMQRVDYVVQRDGARVLSVKVKEREIGRAHV